MVVYDSTKPTYQEYAIDGDFPTYLFQKFDSYVSNGDCQAFHYYMVYDTTGATVHPDVTPGFSIVRTDDRTTDTAKVSPKYTEAKYDFKIKVIGYNDGVAWLNYPFTVPFSAGTSNDTHTLRVYCGMTSTTLTEGTILTEASYIATQFVESHDYNAASPTQFKLPAFNT